MPAIALKAPGRSCKGCGAEIPAQPSGPGRPKVFCSRNCRRNFYHRQEQVEIEREREEQKERLRHESDLRFYGIPEAKRRARLRAQNRERNHTP